MTVRSEHPDTSSTTVLARAVQLTGFDPGRVVTGRSVLVAGTDGVGVRSLVEAFEVVAPEYDYLDRAPSESVGVALLAVDPSSSVGTEERALLDNLRVTYGTVALVCTKIDAFWDWPRILRAHRLELDPHESLPLFAVSALAALSGAVEESGVEALVAWIASELAGPTDIRGRRAQLAAAQGAVERLLDEPDTARSERDALMRRRRTLVENRDRGRNDRLAAVRAGLSRARAESSVQMQTGIRAIATDLSDNAGVAPLRARLDELSVVVAEATDERIGEVRAAAMVGLDSDPEPAEESWTIDTGPIQPRSTGRRGAEDAMVVLIGASSGIGVGRLIVAPMAAVHTLQWISMPLTLVLGLGVAAWVIRIRRAAAVRAQTRGWVIEALGAVRVRADHQIALRVAGAETRIAGQIARSYDRRTRRVAAEVLAIDERVRVVRADAGGRRRESVRVLRQALIEGREALTVPESTRGRSDDVVKEEPDGAGIR